MNKKKRRQDYQSFSFFFVSVKQQMSPIKGPDGIGEGGVNR